LLDHNYQEARDKNKSYRADNYGAFGGETPSMLLGGLYPS